MVDLLLAWHLHRVIGQSAWTVSILMTVFLATGALANLTIGYVLTARNAAASSYVRLQMVGAGAAAVALAGQFLARDIVVVTLVGILFRIAYAMQDVPQNALGSLLPTDDRDAVRYARLRVMLSGAMRVVAILLHLMLLQIDRRIADAIAFVGIGALVFASAVALRGLTFPVRTVRRAAAAPPCPRGLPRLLLGFAIAGALLPTLNRLLIFSPGIEGRVPHFGSWMLAAFCLGSIAGPEVHGRLARGRGEAAPLLAGVAIAIGSAALATFVTSLSLRGVAIMLHGIGLSVIGVHLWASAARIAMRDGAIGQRRDALVASAVILTSHVSMAVGALFLAPLIDAYEAGDPGAALTALLLVCGGGLAILVLAGGRRGEAPIMRRSVPA